MAEVASFGTAGQSVLRAMTPRMDSRQSGRAGGSGPQSARGRLDRPDSRGIQEMSIHEMESVLVDKPRKKPPAVVGGPPISARELLEENKVLGELKAQQKAGRRQYEKDFVQRLLEEDRMVMEGNKAKEQSKKHAKVQLAQQYKDRIVLNQETKVTTEQNEKHLQQGLGYFPFDEGEQIVKNRDMKKDRMRAEMQEQMQKQKTDRPVRKDGLRRDINAEVQYPLSLSRPPPAKGAGLLSSADDALELADNEKMLLVDEPPSFMNKHPLFLTKSKEHMSRRLYDEHVRRTLEDKVEQTKAELLALSMKKQTE
ncbi:unnamed protein product, partial [Polarella glacialis]